MHILYHDDFDGAASAAVLGYYLKDTGLESSLKYVPVDYGSQLIWTALTPPRRDARNEEFAVVDFKYHPNATYWFDHHPDPFQDESWMQHFLRRQLVERLLAWRKTPSCAHLIAKELYLAHEFTELVAAADMIDRAEYPTIEDFFQPKRPEIQLSHAWHSYHDLEKTRIIELLEGQDLEAAAALNPLKVVDAIATNLEALDAVSPYMELRGEVVLVDVVAAGLPYVRFAPFYYFPNALYAITAYAADHDVRLGFGKNPWIEGLPFHLGDWARAHCGLDGFGQPLGGGHPYAAGATVRSGDHLDPYLHTLGLMSQCATDINHRDRALLAA